LWPGVGDKRIFIMLDQKLRYSSVIWLINKYPNATICEVGSGSQGIGPFIKKRIFTGVDNNFADYTDKRRKNIKNMVTVECSALRLPFENNSFDIILSLDMIEHINPDERNKIFSELIRISKKFVIVGFPCGQDAYQIDVRHKKILEKFHIKIPGWLQEHCQIKYPEKKEVNRILDDTGCRYNSFGNESITLHKIIHLIEYVTRGLPIFAQFLPILFLKFIGAKGKKFYRLIYVIEK